MSVMAPTTSPGPSIREALDAAVNQLRETSASATLDAQLLLAAVLNCNRSTLIKDSHVGLTARESRQLDDYVARRVAGAPVAYLTGTKEFWSLSLSITPAVLVPRPETEVLVERVLELIPRDSSPHVLDLGTGSGAIALAIARERPGAQVTGSDISADALAVARCNAKALGLDSVRWACGDWFGAVPGESFDVIVSNPPYIAAGDAHLAALRAEPACALIAGQSGLEAYERIVPEARMKLTATGILALEHGAAQAQALENLLEHHGFYAVRSHPDYSNVPRVVIGFNSQQRSSAS